MAGKSEKITKRAVDAAQPEAKIYRLWDVELKGFGLKVMPSGVKTYIIVYRPYGGGRASPLREFTIGRHGALTPEEARKEASLKLGEVERGNDPQADRQAARAELTVSELCDLYLKEGVATKKASTLVSDKTRIERHIKPLLGSKRVSHVTAVDVERFMRDVAKGKSAVAAKPTRVEAKARGLKKIETRKRKDPVATGGKGTATRTVGLLGAIFTFAMKPGRKLIEINPVRGVERYKDKTAERFLNAEELARLGEAMAATDLNAAGLAVIRLLVLTGARKGEIESLKWSEVDFDFNCLRLGDSKTGQKVLPLGTAALVILQGIERVKGSEFVFPAKDNLKLHYVGTPKVWLAVRAKAGLPDVRLHDLRHTFASLGAGGGQSLPIIGKILGHADVKTTARYAHLADDPVRQAVNRMSETAAAALAGNKGEVIPFKGSGNA